MNVNNKISIRRVVNIAELFLPHRNESIRKWIYVLMYLTQTIVAKHSWAIFLKVCFILMNSSIQHEIVSPFHHVRDQISPKRVSLTMRIKRRIIKIRERIQ